MSATNPIDEYAACVSRGEIPAGRYHRLACERHLRDRRREGTAEFPYRFVYEARDEGRPGKPLKPCALRILEFAEQLKHYKGEWSGSFIKLQAYQRFRLGSLFGWFHVETGLRRFRTAYNEIPRKNGKSLESAIVALYVTFFDGEPGSEGYLIATKREQAKIVFNDAKQLVQSSGLKSRIRVQVANLHREDTASKLEPLGADSDSTDGLNPHFVGVDEFHAHKNRGLIDVMETATGARRQPIIFQITTAGDSPISPCGDQHDYACRILDGVIQDETFFAFIASADPGDAWQDERTWIKANPNWNVSVKPDDMRALAQKAIGIPAAAASFRQKRLNEWVNATAPCLSLDGWRRGQSTTWTAESMRGRSCFMGVDLASSIDLCALACVFPPAKGQTNWRWLLWNWTPAETLADRAHRDRAPYQVWVDQGWLLAPPGTTLDHDLVRQQILSLRKQYRIEQVGFDPWHAPALVKQLTTLDGFSEAQAVAVPQTYAGMSSACLQVQADILAGQIDARGCPVTAWAVSNAVGQRDGKDNLMFAKGKSHGRIDPLIAGTIATALAQRRIARPQRSSAAKMWTPSGFVPVTAGEHRA